MWILSLYCTAPESEPDERELILGPFYSETDAYLYIEKLKLTREYDYIANIFPMVDPNIIYQHLYHLMDERVNNNDRYPIKVDDFNAG